MSTDAQQRRRTRKPAGRKAKAEPQVTFDAAWKRWRNKEQGLFRQHEGPSIQDVQALADEFDSLAACWQSYRVHLQQQAEELERSRIVAAARSMSAEARAELRRALDDAAPHDTRAG